MPCADGNAGAPSEPTSSVLSVAATARPYWSYGFVLSLRIAVRTQSLVGPVSVARSRPSDSAPGWLGRWPLQPAMIQVIEQSAATARGNPFGARRDSEVIFSTKYE